MIGDIEMKFLKKAKFALFIACEIVALLSLAAVILCLINGKVDEAVLYLGMAIFMKVCNVDR